MSQDHIEAVYENGVFRPLSQVALPNHQHVVLRIENGDSASDDVGDQIVARQKRAMEVLDAELEGIPDHSPDDGLSSATHERILYSESR
jgi:predicted DNA-binding antitoxin AbrB/MazE fold protein